MLKVKLAIISILLVTAFNINADVNPLSQYISNEDYQVGIEKFDQDRNIFKEGIVDRDAVVREVRDAENRVKSIFNNILATVNKDNVWGAVIYYTDPRVSGSQRLVITGETAIRVDGYLYYLIPYENGVRVRDIRTGNFYKLEVKGRWQNNEKKVFTCFNINSISLYSF